MAVLFGYLTSFLVSLFGKTFFHAAFKIAITLSFITLFVAAIYAYVSTYSAIVNGIAQTVPDIVSGVWGWVMPDNVNACILAIFSSVILRFVTKLYLSVYKFKFRASISN